jgi:hypothetical protein
MYRKLKGKYSEMLHDFGIAPVTDLPSNVVQKNRIDKMKHRMEKLLNSPTARSLTPIK